MRARRASTGAAVSLASTTLWDKLHRQSHGFSLLSTSCCLRTVSGDRADARARLVLELELPGQFYVHQFIVADVAENMILGLDFLISIRWTATGDMAC